jgi:hypothetical protein
VPSSLPSTGRASFNYRLGSVALAPSRTDHARRRLAGEQFREDLAAGEKDPVLLGVVCFGVSTVSLVQLAMAMLHRSSTAEALPEMKSIELSR